MRRRRWVSLIATLAVASSIGAFAGHYARACRDEAEAERRAAVPLPPPQPWPFWNIEHVDGKPLDAWPGATGAAIPVAHDLLVVPIKKMGEVGKDPSADPRAFLRMNGRLVEGKYVAMNVVCGVAVLRVTETRLRPYPVASSDFTGVATIRLRSSVLGDASYQPVREPGRGCRVVASRGAGGDVGYRRSECRLPAVWSRVDGVAVLNSKDELAAVIYDQGLGNLLGGPNAACLRKVFEDAHLDLGPPVDAVRPRRRE